MNTPDHVRVYDLGLQPYGPTWDLQKRVQGTLIEAKRSDHTENVPHVLLLVEHNPVYTLGKSGSVSNLLVDDAMLADLGVEFFHVDRGGDITHHGPGQLVAYPILDLDAVFTDIHRYLRYLEEVVIRTCAAFGIEAVRIDGRTGVWVPEDSRGPARKICNMGVKCSRWVTMHGLALNVSTDLRYFDYIVPCGLRDSEVTSMSRELGRPVALKEATEPFLEAFSDVFALRIEPSGETSLHTMWASMGVG